MIQSKRALKVGERRYTYWDLQSCAALPGARVECLPVSLKIFLENLLRHEDGVTVTAEDIAAVAAWDGSPSQREIAYYPVRVLMPDSSGIPLLADLAAMRDAMQRLGGEAEAIGPRIPVDLIVDHSVVTEHAGTADAFIRNLNSEYRQNAERYAFLRWAQQAYRNFRVLPPGTGILHQVNMEYIARPVWSEATAEGLLAYPDTLLGMDSHTPMINALGVLGWGVGGIEAGAACLGEPVSLPIPAVVGCRLVGELRPGVTATDLALTVTERLRARKVVGKIVEYCGPGVAGLSLPDRATLANMAPEYGATMGFFPIDAETLRFLALTGRDPQDIALAEAYAKAQGLWGGDRDDTIFSDRLEIDLASVEPSLAGPRRPQDRRPLRSVGASFRELCPQADGHAPAATADRALMHGDVVIAAITSCTNTSNPAGMIGAGMLARNAVQRGLRSRPWVKTSLSPGSRVVSEYLAASGLQRSLDELGFQLTGFGCMTCAGGSGPLAEAASSAIERDRIVAAAVLSSNRNFEGRIHPQVRAAYIGSPALVVAYALAGTVLTDLEQDALGEDRDGRPVTLRDIWPDPAELADAVARVVTTDAFRRGYAELDGDPQWRSLQGGEGATFDWDPASTYLRRPPFFDDGMLEQRAAEDIVGARALLLLGDGITTDHISPANAIPKSGIVADYLVSLGVKPGDFHSFLARRVNHDVMVRGTFGNPRLRNLMVDTEGGYTKFQPSGEVTTIFDASQRHARQGTPLVVIAGAEYGTGSSRDWAAKGTRLLGIRAVIAESFERIHRSNLIGMGVLPLEFLGGAAAKTLGLDGSEAFDILGLGAGIVPGMTVALRIRRGDLLLSEVPLRCRIDTSREVDWYRHGGVLTYALSVRHQAMQPG